MYARLKQIMREHGYNVTPGDTWNTSDTTQFQIFSRMVLGVPVTHPNHVLAYPNSFPQLVALIQNADGAQSQPAVINEQQPVTAEPVAAPADEPAHAEFPDAPSEPEAPASFDVSGGSIEPEAPPAEQVEESPVVEEAETEPVYEGEDPVDEVEVA